MDYLQRSTVYSWTLIARIYNYMVVWSAEIATVLIFVMMLLTSTDVFGRYFFSKPVPGALEITELLMVFIVFLSYAFVEASDQNIKIRIIDKYLSKRQIYFLNIFGSLVGAFIFAIICWQGWFQAWLSVHTDERTTGLLRVIVWPAKFALVFGSFLLTIQFIIGVVSNFRKAISRSEV